jgi:LysM repeat protein
MKWIPFLLVTMALGAGPALRAQDAATQERLDKLSGRIEDLTSGQEALKKQINDLARDLEGLREQLGKPNANYATREELNSLVDKIKDVDQKRMQDADNIHKELLKLRDVLKTPLPQPKRSAITSPKETGSGGAPARSEKGYEYVIKSGDTLSAIIAAYKEKNIKVTVDDLVKANPGLKPERLRVGQKIWIPIP